MDFKTRALCIDATGYGEGDKLLTLVGVENGKMVARARSVKTPKSKLRMCAEVLCCGEYIINRSRNTNLVVGCSIEENFFACWSDLGKYTAAQIICETLNKITIEGVECRDELSLALRALGTVCYAETSPYIIAAWYLSGILRLLGVDIEDTEVPAKQKAFIASLHGMEPADLDSLDITQNELYEALKYLNLLLRNNLSARINSLSEALKQSSQSILH